MRYIGRITLAAFVIVIFTFFSMYYGQVKQEYLLAAPMLALVGWWLGKKYDSAKYDSERDGLTNLYNRRFAFVTLEKLIAMAERHNKKLSILIVDMDDLKKINDTKGHDAGNRAILTVSERLSAVTRKSDIVARIGGDEFLIIAPFTDQPSSKIFTGRILDELSRAGCSVSIGTATFPEDASSLQTLFNKADNRMYEHKRTKGSERQPDSI